jgi:putative ABC transport system permease protein
MIVIRDSILSSLRMLAARSLLSILAILTMGIGIGISTSHIITQQALMNPNLPFPEAHQIVSVRLTGKYPGLYIHKNLFTYWKNHQTSFESLISYTEGTINVFYQNKAIRYTGSWVNPEFADALKVAPFLGEGFKPGDEGLESPRKAILAYDIWEKDFASDPSIIGKDILVNSETTMVVGVMPRGVVFPTNSHIWIPEVYYPGQMIPFDPNPAVSVSGRLTKGVSATEAAEELNQLKEEFAALIPLYAKDVVPEDTQAEIIPFVVSATDQGMKDTLTISTIVVILILLIACANVTNLLLVGYSTRLKEMAIRCALGATRAEIAFQLWIESFVISFAGAGIGLIYSLWAVDWYNAAFAEIETPFWYQLSITKEVIFSTFGVTLLCSVLAALLPAFRVSHLSLNEILQDDSRTASSLSVGTINRSLVILQISVSCALLIVTGLILKQLYVVKGAEFGFDTTAVIGARFGLFEGKYRSVSSKSEFSKKLLEELRAQESIAEATITTRLQTLFAENHITYQVETDETGVFSETPYQGINDLISDGYFRTINLRMISGEDFSYDRPLVDGYKPVIVTQPFVDKHYPDQKVIGKHIRLFGKTSLQPLAETYQIIGVAPNTFIRYGNWDQMNMVGMHFFFENAPTRFQTVVVRPSRGFNQYSIVPLLKRCVANVDNEVPLYFIETPRDSFKSRITGNQFGADMFGLFAGVALFLSFVGTFGITSFSILERIQEIGIRKSLGATGGQIFVLIIKQSLWQLALGILLGIGAGITMSYAFKGVFGNMSFAEFEVYFFALLILAVSSLLATIYPARKAAMILPAEATRIH